MLSSRASASAPPSSPIFFLRRWWVIVLTIASLLLQNTPFFLRGWDDASAALVSDWYVPLATQAREQLTELASLAETYYAGEGGTPRSLPFSAALRQLYQYHAPVPRTPQQAAEFAAECGTDDRHDTTFAKFFRQHNNRRSRLKEDRIIFHTFFRDVPFDELRTYKYVEIGGYTGMDESNSRFFEACLGWEGLLVEPNPVPFQKLVVNRPHAHRASFAASCSESDALQNKTIPFHDYPFANAAQAGTNNPYAGRRTTNVPCGPLTPLLHDLLGGRVHFFSLDVEGAEPLVLEHFDFASVFVDVLLVEVENYHCPAHEYCESRNRTRSILRANGYDRFERYVAASDLYVHPRSPFRSKMNGIAHPDVG